MPQTIRKPRGRSGLANKIAAFLHCVKLEVGLDPQANADYFAFVIGFVTDMGINLTIIFRILLNCENQMLTMFITTASIKAQNMASLMLPLLISSQLEKIPLKQYRRPSSINPVDRP